MLFRSLLVAALAGVSVNTAETFSFAEWVEGIIANPDGDNLTPEEAVAAWEASVNNTEAGLEKRVNCNAIVGKEVAVPDAVWCIDYLAEKGARGIECEACATATMCHHGTAAIWAAAGGVDENSSSVTCASTNCNNIARTGG